MYGPAKFPVSYSAIFISKGSYGVAEPKTVNLESVRTTYKLVRACKPSVFMQRGIVQTIEISVNLGLPISMVPCLHQSNLHIKRKLWGRKAWKCTPCVGASNVQTCTSLQSTRFYAGRYWADKINWQKFGVPIAIVPCFHQSNLHI